MTGILLLVTGANLFLHIGNSFFPPAWYYHYKKLGKTGGGLFAKPFSHNISAC